MNYVSMIDNIHRSSQVACVQTSLIGQYKIWTADYGLRTGYKIRTRYKTRTGKYGLGIKHGLGIKRGLQAAD